MTRSSSMAAVGLLVLTACGGPGGPEGQGAKDAATTTTPTTTTPTTTTPAPGGGGGGASGARLTVMTRNLYLGADIRRIAAAATPEEIPAAAGAMWRVILDSDFFARAEAIADEIEAAGPHLVALQEVSLYRTGLPTACSGTLVPATEVTIDFLDDLASALAARGLDYVVARQVQNFDAQLCTKVGAETFIDVRLTDRDVILARGDLTLSNPRSGNFTAAAQFPAGGGTLPVPRGWASVDVASPLGDLRFVATHLEVEGFAEVQQAQAAELVGLAADGLGAMPLVLAGDFNAGPELAQVTTTYDDLLAAGHADPWPALHPADPGLTCCFDEGLTTGTLTQRIDLILYLGPLAPVDSVLVGLVANTEPGLYPSDHAGLITTFSAPAGGGDCPEDEECECDHHHHRDCDDHHGDEDCDRDHKDCDRDHRDCGRDHRDCGRDHKDRKDCKDKKRGGKHEDCSRHRGG